MPSRIKKATNTIVSVSAPASGRKIRIKPNTLANKAVSNDHAKPGIPRDRQTDKARKMPPMKNSQPTKMLTASVATLGSTTARNPRTIITMPCARTSFQCRWIVAAIWRRMPSIPGSMFMSSAHEIVNRATIAASSDPWPPQGSRGGPDEKVEAALQYVGSSDAIDDLGAALPGHVVGDHLTGHDGGRHPFVPKDDRQVAECQQVPRELAHRLRAGPVGTGKG